MTRRRVGPVGALFILLAAGTLAQPGDARRLPAISMTCPVHPDVIESAAGTCPYCNRTLVPVRLAPAWTCPIHSGTIADSRGTCPVCRRQLVPVTVSLAFTCRGSSAKQLEPGTCPDGAPMTLERALRPHGDHNPRHGGQFFMASDNWHHVEGVYPAPRVFRLYVYDDYARPLPADRMKALQARAVTRERFDPARQAYIEERAFALRVASNGAYLESRVDTAALPAEITAKVKFDRDTPEYRFDFTFTGLTQSAPSGLPATAARPAENRATDPDRAARPAASPAALPVVTATASRGAGRDSAPGAGATIPPTVSGILEQLRARDQQIASLIAQGDFGAVWVPAFQAKSLALALEPHLAHLAGEHRDTGALALQKIVRLSWLLDAHGDTGGRQSLVAAHAALSSAIADAIAVFGDMAH